MRIESFYVSFPVSDGYKGIVEEELKKCLRPIFPSFAIAKLHIGDYKYFEVLKNGKLLSKRTKT